MYLFTVDYKIYIGYNQITIIQGGEIHERMSSLAYHFGVKLRFYP